jgi:hypothetical protein
MSKNLRNRNYSLKLNAKLDKTTSRPLNDEIFISMTFRHTFNRFCKKLSSLKHFCLFVLNNIFEYILENLWLPICQRQLSHIKCLEKSHCLKLTKLIENSRSETVKKQIQSETLTRSLYEGFIQKFMANPK